MRKSVYSHTAMFVAGLVLGVLLTVQIPKMLEAQQLHILHPDYRQGFIWETGNPFDIAIEGRGYFQFERSDGTPVFSRYSHFTMDETGTVISKDTRYPLSPNIIVPDNFKELAVSTDGTVTITYDSNNSKQVVGRIHLYIFNNPDSLDTTNDEHYFQESEKSGPPSQAVLGKQAGVLKQGYTMVK